MKKHFDVIVIGVGSMGSATCYYLSKQGASVLGIEQFDIPHDQGSHAGQSRIIRKAYFEHPDYVPLLHRAYHNWTQLEEATNTQLYFKTGLFYAGPRDNDLIKGTTLAAQLHHLPLENITGTDHAKTRNFTIPSHHEKWFEPDAGCITPERAVLTFAQEAIRSGATLLTRQRVIEWKKTDGEFLVEANSNTFTAKKIIVCGGAWSGKLLPHLNTKLKVTRQVVVWMNPKNWDDFTSENFPCWLVADEDLPGAFYGFPILPAGKIGGPLGLKFAYHHPGLVSNPDQVDRTTTQEDVSFILSAVKKFLPSALGSVLSVKTCLYTYSPDEHFIIDTHPLDENLIVAAGFSGHGFKFASVVGEVLSDLARTGKTNLPIDFLRMKRLQNKE
ncbi:MAG: N-methyl-L-tryptophan oxidase [Flammeovirgaceae bacterium]